MTPQWQRCFIALSPDDDTRGQLVRLPVSAGVERIAPEDFHLTLAFLGGLSQDQAAHLAQSLPWLAVRIRALRANGIEHWPSPDRPRVEVVTFELPQALAELVERLNPLLEDLGLPMDGRAFRPHVTLGRFRRGKDAAASAAAIPAAVCPMPHAGLRALFDELALYCRAAQGGHPRYIKLASTTLAGAATPPDN